MPRFNVLSQTEYFLQDDQAAFDCARRSGNNCVQYMAVFGCQGNRFE